MSPEQAKGKTADRRSDVWAFGCVLFEMLPGRRAFEGEDVSDTLANVLKAQPDWNALPAPPPFDDFSGAASKKIASDACRISAMHGSKSTRHYVAATPTHKTSSSV